jgi:mannose-6-phosphate isomerase-like protein (cupin superfamily)
LRNVATRSQVGIVRENELQILSPEDAKSSRGLTRSGPGDADNRLITEEWRLTMIRSGDTLTNPVTGEQLHFVETVADTDGEYVLVEVTVEPNGFVAAAHVHPYQTETFEILEGQLHFQVGDRTVLVGADECLRVHPGTPHRFWNAGDRPASFSAEIRPALGFESLIETMFALAGDGKTNRKGLPNPLRLAVIAKAHFDDVRLPFPPAWMQRIGLALGSPLGRLLGYRETYERSIKAARSGAIA